MPFLLHLAIVTVNLNLSSFSWNLLYIVLLFLWQALSSIESEEDAEMALQLSSTLTQALLAYRIKNVTKVSVNMQPPGCPD